MAVVANVETVNETTKTFPLQKAIWHCRKYVPMETSHHIPFH